MNFDWKYSHFSMPRITLTPFGMFVNEAAILLLGHPDKILIGFDPDKVAIGIKPYEGEENVKPYSVKMIKGNVKIYCKDFIKVLSKKTGISFEHATRYNVKSLLNNVIYIDIENRKPKKTPVCKKTLLQ